MAKVSCIYLTVAPPPTISMPSVSGGSFAGRHPRTLSAESFLQRVGSPLLSLLGCGNRLWHSPRSVSSHWHHDAHSFRNWMATEWNRVPLFGGIRVARNVYLQCVLASVAEHIWSARYNKLLCPRSQDIVSFSLMLKPPSLSSLNTSWSLCVKVSLGERNVLLNDIMRKKYERYDLSLLPSVSMYCSLNCQKLQSWGLAMQ